MMTTVTLPVYNRALGSVSSSLNHSAGSNRLVGLVVKASASRAEGPGFESRLRRDFFGVESYHMIPVT